MIKREIWEEHSFDEKVTNIEDQIWANEVTDAGYKIVYEPEAAVYHHHGINKANQQQRTENVVRTMENHTIQDDDLDEKLNANPLDPAELDIVSFVPIRQKTSSGVDSNEELIEKTVSAVTESTYIDDLFISSDTEYVVDESEEWGVSGTFLRPDELSASNVHVLDVHKYTLNRLEETNNRYPDLVVPIEITLPFRPPNVLDHLIEKLVNEGHDSVVATWAEYRPSWKETDASPRRLNEQDVRSERTPIQIGLPSLGCVTRPQFLRQGERVSGDVGFYEIKNPFAKIEIREREDLKYWETLVEINDLIDDV